MKPGGVKTWLRKVARTEAACKHRDDRAHRSREDDVDGGDHEGVIDEGDGAVQELR